MILKDTPRIDRAELMKRAEGTPMSDSRFVRALKQPWKNSTIGLMRLLGLSAPVRCRTFWNGVFHGLLPEAVSSLVWRFGLYEKTTSLFLLRFLPEGGRFVDVGAHFGYFTVLASRLVGAQGCVVAIEAMPRTYSYLQENVRANRASNVLALNIAAASKRHKMTFRDFGVIHSSLNSSGAARGVLAGRSAPATLVDVEGQPLDDVLEGTGIGPVDIIKIDAESSEEDVLLGLSSTLLQDQPPMVLVELGGGDTEEDLRSKRILRWMQERGFDAYIYNGGKLRPLRISSRFPYANVIFVHRLCMSEIDVGASYSPESNENLA